ncbi:amidase family protein [Congregibacter litoralis]|uniref:Asp-tRNAAsn/Glu-tRNAGln amidotransferase A subunit n=1 Tax=Congregibacter litoralis KT71 TaxID=314285 RepID=A4ADP6_9GAMM|nr:amidase family protein [Congregibacter litoralis]EAQ95854.1 Asp-tRNAAsn/Glu-tRNAGln amidotransferase A subunit [Congregibacter litoralis KT71]
MKSINTRGLLGVFASGMLTLSALPVVFAAQDATPVLTRITAVIADIKNRDAQYRAVIALDPEAQAVARSLDLQRRAPGPLHGEPILLKDNIESKGQATTAGSLALAENRTGRDAPLVAQLRQGGAVILGKANLSEWANFRSEFSSSGWSGVGGQTRNAIDPARTPCGSSSGSAVAVALGYVDVAIGTETSGSIVCPASINGVVGFKPTQGLVSGEGIVPLASTQDTAGPIANSVPLAARTLAVMSDPQAENSRSIRKGLMTLDAVSSLEGLRIGIFARTQNYDPRRDAELDRVLALLKSKGATLIPGLDIEPYEGYGQDSYDVLLYEFRRDLNAYLAGLPNALSSMTLASLIAFNEEHAEDELKYFDQSIFLKAQSLPDSEEEYRRKRKATQKAMREDGLDKLFGEHALDALLGITVGPAWMIDWVNGDAFFGPGMAGQAAVAGNPHITLPLGQLANLPIGVSLIGERWQDHKLAAIAALLETAHEEQ